jgi:hypothetical protein
MSTFEVQLAIYDLSRGMARTLSAQFLGGPQHAIDAIPHTGIVVYGRVCSTVAWHSIVDLA